MAFMARSREGTGDLAGSSTIRTTGPGASIPTEPAISAATADLASILSMAMRRLPQGAVIKAGPGTAVVLSPAPARTHDLALTRREPSSDATVSLPTLR